LPLPIGRQALAARLVAAGPGSVFFSDGTPVDSKFKLQCSGLIAFIGREIYKHTNAFHSRTIMDPWYEIWFQDLFSFILNEIFSGCFQDKDTTIRK
jgi:hypothetical protein